MNNRKCLRFFGRLWALAFLSAGAGKSFWGGRRGILRFGDEVSAFVVGKISLRRGLEGHELLFTTLYPFRTQNALGVPLRLKNSISVKKVLRHIVLRHKWHPIIFRPDPCERF